jgi:hypothetical protein
VIPVEDGVRLELELDSGQLFAFAPLPGPVKGETVSLRVSGGVTFQGATVVPDAPEQTVMP